MIKYFKTLWENNITPVNGRNLNKIEDALEYLYDVIRNVPSEENVRIANEKQRQSNETTRSNSEVKRNATFDSKIKDVDKAINASNENIVEVNNKFESITASKQQDAEVIIARDGEESLNNRLKRDLYVDNITLKQKVLDIEGLKEMQDLEYETDNGYKVCQNTKNGVVKDLKIYGKSLVNLKDEVFKYDNVYMAVTFKYDLEPNKTYTVILNGFNKDNFRYHVCYNSDGSQPVYSSSEKIVVFNTPSDLINNARRVYLYPKEGYTITQSDIDTLKPVILEGDHTQNHPSGYFEGIASVGNGNEIEVLSRKEDGNVIPPKYLTGGVNAETGEDYNQTTQYIRSDYFTLVKGRYYVKELESNPKFLYLYNLNGGYIGKKTINSQKYVDIDNSCNARIDMNLLRVATDEDLNSIKVALSTSENPNLVNKQDKKPILFKDADGNWKPVTELNEFDILDSTRKKLYKNGSIIDFKGASDENWILSGSSSTTLVFKISSPSNSDAIKEVICNNFGFFRQAWDASKQKEGIEFDSNGNVYVQILKTKLTTLDANGFKTWLQSNHTTVVYALLKALVYDVSPTDTEAFENETMWMIESGPVSPHAEFKVTSSIQNFAKNTAERVDRLEDEVYKMNLANFAVSLNALELKSRLEALEAPQK